MSSTNIYYVYAYIRSKDSATAKAGTPYYIGKGKEDRVFAKHNKIGVPKDKTNIVFLETSLTDCGALALERRMIRWYGRKDLKTGILLNRTDGGDGSAGSIRSQETKMKISNFQCGKIHSEESKLKMSIAKRGNKSYAALKINIYDSNNVLLFSCHGDFEKVCTDNNLPLKSLRLSYQNDGQPLAARLKKFIGFKGWYAVKQIV